MGKLMILKCGISYENYTTVQFFNLLLNWFAVETPKNTLHSIWRKYCGIY